MYIEDIDCLGSDNGPLEVYNSLLSDHDGYYYDGIEAGMYYACRQNAYADITDLKHNSSEVVVTNKPTYGQSSQRRGAYIRSQPEGNFDASDQSNPQGLSALPGGLSSADNHTSDLFLSMTVFWRPDLTR